MEKDNDGFLVVSYGFIIVVRVFAKLVRTQGREHWQRVHVAPSQP